MAESNFAALLAFPNKISVRLRRTSPHGPFCGLYRSPVRGRRHRVSRQPCR